MQYDVIPRFRLRPAACYAVAAVWLYTVEHSSPEGAQRCYGGLRHHRGADALVEAAGYAFKYSMKHGRLLGFGNQVEQ